MYVLHILLQMFEEAKQKATSNITLTPGCGKLNCELVFHVTLTRNTKHPNKVNISDYDNQFVIHFFCLLINFANRSDTDQT